ncbi:hypothetical protein C8R45DRAFT_1073340 [Mycena sanguinolenta]|nr:hypothetical protein C8R45DRAFT_1073340 [Mycena sanguinolenta]
MKGKRPRREEMDICRLQTWLLEVASARWQRGPVHRDGGGSEEEGRVGFTERTKFSCGWELYFTSKTIRWRDIDEVGRMPDYKQICIPDKYLMFDTVRTCLYIPDEPRALATGGAPALPSFPRRCHQTQAATSLTDVPDAVHRSHQKSRRRRTTRAFRAQKSP